MEGDAKRIAHHDLCFGCGLANVFGLQLELEERDGEALGGRFFVKQDHQGAPGVAHAGVLASALVEAMALACGEPGTYAEARALQLELHRPAPVGAYVEITARTVADDGDGRRASAELRDARGELVAEGQALFAAPGTAR
jgi:acyl-coenzyme A thioesterase PaaI-like protein